MYFVEMRFEIRIWMCSNCINVANCSFVYSVSTCIQTKKNVFYETHVFLYFRAYKMEIIELQIMAKFFQKHLGAGDFLINHFLFNLSQK